MASDGEVLPDSCTIEASVPTGFESVAADEAKEMFSTDYRIARGKIIFQTPTERVQDILKLGGIDHCRCQILHIPSFDFTPDGDDCLTRLQLLVKQCHWKEGLEIWNKFYTFDHPIAPQPDVIPTDEELVDVCHSIHMPGSQAGGERKKKKSRRDKRKGRKGNDGGRDPAGGPSGAGDLPGNTDRVQDGDVVMSAAPSSETSTEGTSTKDLGTTEGTDSRLEEETDSQAAAEGIKPGPVKKPRDPTKPVFRVTCKRTGENHSFDSMSAAASLGSAVQTYFGWSVDMTNFNIEVVLSIDNNEVSVGLALTPDSLHKRNLVAFGVTTLRPTICHNMLRMVKIKPGHVVCDPLCGTASISIQGALSFPAMQLCGDNHNVAMEKTLQNKDALNNKRKAKGSGGLMMDAIQWNACHLPLKDGIVDVFVSDLPFGKRVGRRSDNVKLYCNVLDEMARCCKHGGRAALLTGDMNNMIKAIQGQKYWNRRRCYSCNIGGIPAGVFLLFRTEIPYTSRSNTAGARHARRPQQSQHHPSDSSRQNQSDEGRNNNRQAETTCPVDPDGMGQEQEQNQPLPSSGSGLDESQQDGC